jgi:putative ABC transport system substrate-binding protein
VNRRRFLLTSLAGAVAARRAAEARQADKVARLGWLGPDQATHRREWLLQSLRDLGSVEGRNITIEYRFAKGHMERLPAIAAELVALDVDVIVAVSQPAAQAAQQATRSIPIVMFGVGDPVSTGLVATLTRPGGNITGLSELAPELSAKRLALLREVIPHVSRVAVLSNPSNPSNAYQIDHTETAAKALGVRLQVLEVQRSEDLDKAFQSAARGRAGGLVTLGDLFIFTQRLRIVALAAQSKLPGMYGWPVFPQAGGLMSYSPDFRDMTRHATIFVDKILRGARPADLPIQQRTKFELVINLTTAKALGLTIPPSLLARADQLIQ